MEENSFDFDLEAINPVGKIFLVNLCNLPIDESKNIIDSYVSNMI